MNDKEFKAFVVAARAAPKENIERALFELSRYRAKNKSNMADHKRYKAVFAALINPTQEFLSGLVNCKTYSDIDGYSYKVLQQQSIAAFKLEMEKANERKSDV